MPVKLWETQADFNTWTLTDVVATAGNTLALDTGESEGTATSPAYEALNWVRWGRLRLEIEQPTGTNVYVRWRSGTDQAECLAADWSPWDDLADDAGIIILNLGLYYLNTPLATVGPWVQLEVRLEAE
jgi:hypothetical protein